MTSGTPQGVGNQGQSKRCGAKRRNGEPCRMWAMPNGRCRIHGGKSPAGLASGTYKHGRYSKYLPTRLLDRYHASAQDPELLALRDDIGLVDARLGDLLGRIDTGESGAIWLQLKQAHGEYVAGKGKGDVEQMRQALERIESLIDRGLADYAAWTDVHRCLDQRRKLVESERKRLIDMHSMITAEQAMMLLTIVTDTIRRHVTDRHTLAAIAQELSGLVAGSTRGIAGPH